MVDNKLSQWEASYSRGENHIYYPQIEVVKFLSRFVPRDDKDQLTHNELTSVAPKQALDFACGIGAQSFLLSDFGFNVTGLDISTTAISYAEQRKTELECCKNLNVSFRLIDGPTDLSFYATDFFHVSVAESCLDSMEYNLACDYFQEIKRITSRFIYLSLISGQDKSVEDEIVTTSHENGTIQSYYDENKIKKLLGSSYNQVKYFNKITENNLLKQSAFNERFHIVIDLLS